MLGYELDGAAFEVNQEAAFDDVEEFVFVIVFVPVKFALHNAEANYAVVHAAESLLYHLSWHALTSGSRSTSSSGANFVFRLIEY